MVLDLAEMDFNLKVKWFIQPRQLDGSTVEDYYAQFCNWRHEMVRLSIPADEEDYVEKFTLNLRWDVRCRLCKYGSSWSRLIDAYYDARFAESMMIIEENIRQIKAQNVFDEMPNSKSKHNDELQDAEDVGNVESGDLVVQLEADHGNFVPLNADCNVLDKLPRPVLTETAAYMPIDELDAHCVLNSQTGVTFDQVIGNSKVEALKLINKSTEQNFTGSVNGSTNGLTMASIEKVTSILKVALGKNVTEDNAHEVFDERSKIRTHFDGILLFVYDPGGSLPLPMDCEVLNTYWDYTINMSKIISKVIEMCLVQVMPKIVVASGDCPYKHLGMLISLIILNVVPIATVSSIFLARSLISICLVEPNKESYANKYDRYLLSLDSVDGLRYVERSCWFTPLSMNNLVPPSPNSVTMAYYGSIVTATCFLVDPGGGYLLLIASRGIYTRNAENEVPKDMCVGMVELGSNKACKPLIELLVDYLFFTQEALDLDDVELGHMTFSIVPTMLLPGVVLTIVVVSHDFAIEAGSIFFLVRKDVRTFRHFYVVADKIKLLYGGELATEMVMFNGVEWNLQTEEDCSVWLEAISLDITIIHCLDETFCQLMVLKSRPMLLMNVKVERNRLLILNGIFLGQLQLPFYCHSVSLFAFHNLSCMIGCFIPCGLKHFQQYMSSNGYDVVIVTKLQNYVWDPGQNVIHLYILEDKDVVERVGKDMVLMDTTLVTRGYDHEVQMSCLDTMKFFVLSILHIGLDTIRLGKFELDLLASHLKHFKQYYGYDDILDNIFEAKKVQATVFFGSRFGYFRCFTCIFYNRVGILHLGSGFVHISLAGLQEGIWSEFSFHHLEDKVAFEGKDMS